MSTQQLLQSLKCYRIKKLLSSGLSVQINMWLQLLLSHGADNMKDFKY